MKLITWNINSVRIRLHLLKKLIELEQPDVILLQETKVRNEFFPQDIFVGWGYKYTSFHGEKSYNGVAIISKLPINSIYCLDLMSKGDCRHQVAVLDNGIEIHNFYIPAGGDIPDPTINSKFQYKLAYIDNARAWFRNNRTPSDRMILAGDLNIAPLENDVWSHKQLLKEVSHSPIEIEKYLAWYNEFEWIDAIRYFVEEPQKLYSWWSYRNIDWKKHNRGRRLDHIWITKPLVQHLSNSYILTEARDWDLPSDHVPVVSLFQWS